MHGTTDLLREAEWMCLALREGGCPGPGELPSLGAGEWIPASVPGTVVGALRQVGQWSWTDDDEVLLDGQDWWFRTLVPPTSATGPWWLELDGLATIGDVWVDAQHVLHSKNMFLAHSIEIGGPTAPCEIVIRFAALTPLLERRRPRPRWKSRLIRRQNLRWFRTTPLGRIDGWSFSGAPVGPWRPVRLMSCDVSPHVVEQDVHARAVGGGGEVTARFVIHGDSVSSALLRVGTREGRLAVTSVGGRSVVEGCVILEEVAPWWPHTHGEATRYPLTLVLDGREYPLPSIGFRSVVADRSDDGFRLSINGEPIFCRGACWVPPDATGLGATAEEVRASLQSLCDAGMNMVRVGGYTTYEDATFWGLCDELGIMVWQDCMLASADPPEDAGFLADLEVEVAQVLGALRSHPALAVLSGSSEIHQQAAMFGVPLKDITSTAIDVIIPAIAEQLVPEVPYLPSSPTGGDLPFDPSRGVGHYFGVGAYQRPASEARSAGIRFAAECLSFATPPEDRTVEEFFGDASLAGHHPLWKRGVARDSGTSWDFEDVRDHYVGRMFGVDPYRVRYEDPERALNLGRAVIAELMSVVAGAWRCRASGCGGALVLDWQDLYPGAGWGLLDVVGRPKAPWYSLRRCLAPVAVVLTDDGLSGLGVHAFNDRPEPQTVELRLRLFTPYGNVSDTVSRAIDLPSRSEIDLSAAGLLGEFRDLTHAYRFGPPGTDVVAADLLVAGESVSTAFHLPGGLARPPEVDLGLRATARREDDGPWLLTVSTDRFAQWVRIDVPGFRPTDSWFHLAPGESRRVVLNTESRLPDSRPPRGQVAALNLLSPMPIQVE